MHFMFILTLAILEEFFVHHVTYAQYNPYPYMVSIENLKSNHHLCSGVLLSENKVLTTCQCISEEKMVSFVLKTLNTSDHFVVAGISVSMIKNSIVIRKVMKFYHHENCRKDKNEYWSFNYGFAIVSKNFPLNAQIQLVPLFSKFSSDFLKEMYALQKTMTGCTLVNVTNSIMDTNAKERKLHTHTLITIDINSCISYLCNVKSEFCGVRLAMYGQICGLLKQSSNEAFDMGSPVVCKTSKEFVLGILMWPLTAIPDNKLVILASLEPALVYIINEIRSSSATHLECNLILFCFLLVFSTLLISKLAH